MSIPLIFTSYEEWRDNANNKLIKNTIYSKVKEFTNCAMTDEECNSLAYTIIESLQFLEYRDFVYIEIDKRIKRMYSMQFAKKHILDIMTDPKVYSAAFNFISNKLSMDCKKNLDIAISHNLIGMTPPNENTTKEYEIKYNTKKKEFQALNKKYLIP